MTDMEPITLDLDSLTLGEMAELERVTGRDIVALLNSGAATRRLMAVYVHESRTSERPRSWQELGRLRLSDVSPSRSPSRPAGDPATSSG